MSQIEDTDLQLLLTDAEELVPVLENGLPEATLGELPQPGASDAHSTESEAEEHDPNDLATQRWAVIAPAGDAGGRMLEAIQALVEHRKDQQGAAPRVFRVPPAMDIDASLRWRDDVLRGEDIPLDEQPRYLLILGDLHEVSLSLQQVLAGDTLVGRLQCPTIKGFRDYAEKVVAREKAEPAADGRALFYTVQDGTAAIGAGYGHLIEPCMKMTQDRVGRGSLSLAGVEEIPYSDWGPDDMLAQVGVDAPSVLLSLTHGLGAPRKGWRSPDHQRATQGALSMGLEKPLTADAVVKAPFLPGGVWFCQACFAAGTPDASGFSSWLSRMAERGGHRPAARDILRSLPATGERPFVAALPQTLLANPRGPLAVLGHADLAWTFGFVDPLHSKSRASRLFAALQAVLAGNRVGVALDAMTHARRELDDDLARHHRAQRDALARGEPEPVAPRTLGRLWIQRNDLRGHVLLGDPAVRLPIKSTPPPVRSGPAPQKPARRPPIEASPPIDAPASPAVEPAQRPAPAPATARAPSPPVESPAPPVIEAAPAPNPPSESPVADSPATPPRAPAAPHASAPTERIEPRGEAAHNIVPDAPSAPLVAPTPVAPPQPVAPSPAPSIPAPSRLEVPMSTTQPPPPAYPPDPTYATAPAQAPPISHAHAPFPAHAYAPPPGAAPLGAMVRPRTLENPEIALRERAVLAMLRGDEAPRSIAVRFGLPLEEVFYWLDVYREAGRKALGG